MLMVRLHGRRLNDGSFPTSVKKSPGSLPPSAGVIGKPLSPPLRAYCKENLVGTFGILYGLAEAAEDGEEFWGTFAKDFSTLSAYSFLIFNLLCAPCVAAMGAIRREMNNGKWTLFAIGYQCGFAYAVSLIFYQFGMFLTTGVFTIGTAFAAVIFAILLYLLLRPAKKYEGAVEVNLEYNK